jgi:hypothetical protein
MQTINSFSALMNISPHLGCDGHTSDGCERHRTHQEVLRASVAIIVRDDNPVVQFVRKEK